MKSIVNFRTFLLTAVVAAATVLLCTYINVFTIISLAVLAAVLLSLAIVSAFNGTAVRCAAFCISLIVMAICLISVTIVQSSFSDILAENRNYSFEGKIISVDDSSPSQAEYIISDVVCDGEKVNGNIYLCVEVDSGEAVVFLRVGDMIAFNSEVTRSDFVEGEPNGYLYRNNIYYYVSISESELHFLSSAPNLFDSLKNNMRITLKSNLGSYGELVFAAITGEKSGLSDYVRDVYSASGIAHILAVSGLHVGVASAFLYLLLGKLKCKKYPKLIITAATLMFYCFLSGFSPSVVRASIMLVIGLIADALVKQRDSLSALGFSVTLMLCVAPYFLFDSGFLLSVFAVFGILSFSQPLEKLLRKIKLPRKLSSALATSFSAQVATIPIMLCYFSQFSVYAILVNIIVIPLFSIAYVACLVALIIVMLVPGLGILLNFAVAPLVIIDTIAEWISLLPFANLLLYAPTVLMSIYLLEFTCGKFFVLTKRKLPIVIVTAVLFIVSVVFVNIPVYSDCNVIAYSGYKDVTTVIRTDDKTIIVGDVKRGYALENCLERAKIRYVDAIFVNNLDSATVASVLEISDKFNCCEVYCSVASSYSAVDKIVGTNIDFRLIAGEELYGVTAVLGESGFCGYSYCDGNANMLMLGYGFRVDDVPTDIINDSAIIRSYVFSGNVEDRVYIVNYENGYIEDEPISLVACKKNVVAFDLSSGRYAVID